MSRNVGIGVVFGVILPIAVFAILKKMPLSSKIGILFNILKHWFPCVSVGFMSYKYNLLGKIDGYLENVNKNIESVEELSLKWEKKKSENIMMGSNISRSM